MFLKKKQQNTLISFKLKLTQLPLNNQLAQSLKKIIT